MQRLVPLALLSLAALACGCKSVGGHLYPAWAASVARITCVPALGAGALIRVTVANQSGAALPGAQVQYIPDSASPPFLTLSTGTDGTVAFPVSNGRARIVISLAGFVSATTRIAPETHQECNVLAFLELSSVRAVVY